MAKVGIKGQDAVYNHYKTICEIVKNGDISAEVVSTDFKQIVEEGKKLLRESGMKLTTADSMDEAATKVVELAG